MAESALTKTNWAPPTPENHMALAVLCIIGFVAYWVPTLAANSNRHRNRAAIGMLNLLLGWTFVGWVVALLWATPITAKIDDRSGPTEKETVIFMKPSLRRIPDMAAEKSR